MKKLISYILLTVILAIFFCGCGKDEKEMSGTPNLEEIQGTNKMNGQEEAGDPKGFGGWHCSFVSWGTGQLLSLLVQQ